MNLYRCDTRLPRVGGRAGGITWEHAEYDQGAMREMLKALRDAEVDGEKLVTEVYFNDPDLIKEGLCKHLSGHDDHLHITISPPTLQA